MLYWASVSLLVSSALCPLLGLVGCGSRILSLVIVGRSSPILRGDLALISWVTFGALCLSMELTVHALWMCCMVEHGLPAVSSVHIGSK